MTQFFFVHVMKTAGTTFAFHLRRQFPAETIYPWTEVGKGSPDAVEAYASIPRLLALAPDRRALVQVYTGHFPYMAAAAMGDDLVTLTLLREPVARTISVLRHFKRLHDRYRELPLEAIYEDDYVYRHFVVNHQTKIFSLVPDDEPRAIMRPLTIDDDRFALAKANLARVDVVGLTDHYVDFTNTLRRRFGWWRGVKLRSKANVSPEDDVVAESLMRRIADDNAYDVEFYRYAVDLVDGRAEGVSGAGRR